MNDTRSLRVPAGIASGLVLLASLAIAAPLGRLRDPLVLVIVLPPLAASLDALGWGRVAGRAIGGVGGPVARLFAAYLAWLAMSALLTLDVAAVVASSVGLEVGSRSRGERDTQLGAAIVGSNVGSLLFPFSNLTNLVLLAGAGISFRAYVTTAALPQLATAVAAGVVLLWRGARRVAGVSGDGGAGAAPAVTDVAPEVTRDGPDDRGAAAARHPRVPARVAGAVVLAGSVAAVIAGFAGGDIAGVFAITGGLVVAIAIGSGEASPRALASGIPLLGIAVILAAAVLGGPIAAVAARLPLVAALPPTPVVLAAVALTGGILAATINNLPAAAFGAVWLRAASPALVIAYLIGTNVLALVTPHGSLATVLCRSVAERSGHAVPHGPYLRAAWRFAAVGALAALAALTLFG